MNTQNGTFDSVIQTQLDTDTEFQSLIESLTDEEEKARAIEAKKQEIIVSKASEWYSEAENNRRIAEDQRKRAEKAEQKKHNDEGSKKTADDSLAGEDVIALISAGVNHADDIEEVKKAAKLFGLSIRDTLQDSLVQARLKQAKEFRASKEAMNTETKRAGAAKSTDAEILERSRNGEVFPKGSPEAEQLFWAKRKK